jgi:hypothetical protein
MSGNSDCPGGELAVISMPYPEVSAADACGQHVDKYFTRASNGPGRFFHAKIFRAVIHGR